MIIDQKTQLIQALDVARDELWRLVDALDAAVEIYPGWKKREFLAHIAGWEAVVFDVFRRHVAGLPPKTYPFSDLDGANAYFVSVRQSTTVDDAKLECDINRYAIKQMLDKVEDFGQTVRFPWGNETIITFLEGAIDHEKTHGADLLNLVS